MADAQQRRTGRVLHHLRLDGREALSGVRAERRAHRASRQVPAVPDEGLDGDHRRRRRDGEGAQAVSAAERGAVRVVLYFRLAEGQDVDELVQAYHESSKALQGTPGMLRNELLRSSQEPARFAVLSEWRDRHAFQEWENGARHKGQTASIRRFADPHPSGAPFAIYDVVEYYAS
ncbi:antibiotic biosynthesis monooxygenase [Streptomyces luteolifulvus]|uniref:Antibiotic biosynthesis monooxygenase n=1 Tax=Streptomyces luteolifulvus TaxID=2615112 RepID=A0A6H9UU23_9ACTN|nr:antibiotic biosynthesis monooxygenase [Streptomyces luteolifulvus]